MRMNRINLIRNILANNTVPKTIDEEFYKEIFWNNDSLREYGKEIIEHLLNKEDESLTNICLNENFRIKYLSIIYTIIKNSDENKKFYDNIFFFVVKISDKLISHFRYEINEKALELIYYGAFCIAIKYETGTPINFSVFENCLKDCLIKKNELILFEITINELLNYNYLFSYPEDFLQIYENIDKTQSIKELDLICKLLIKFELFTNRFSAKKTSLIALTAYHYGKLKIMGSLKWSYHIQLLTGYDKEQIIENIRELNYEIKYNYNIFIKLLTNKFNNNIFK